MKRTKLYIFTTSDIPDPYINAIAHCAADPNGLSQVTLIGITEDRGKISSKRAELNKLDQDIHNQLDKLSKGQYLKKKDNIVETLSISIEETDSERYRGLKDFPCDIKVWVYRDLEQEISALLDSNKSFTCIFDVTTFLKSYLVDVYTILRFKEISAIHSFELLSSKRSYDQNELIHNLTEGKTYIYSCLAESQYTKDKIVANKNSIISRESFELLQSDVKALQNELNYLEDLTSIYFARFWSLIYFLLGLPLLLISCWLVFKHDGWNWFEPIAFIITFSWFIVNYVLQGVFAGRFPSLDPRESFNALKARKKKFLENSRLNRNERF